MSFEQSTSDRGVNRLSIDGKLAAYLAATGALGSVFVSDAQAVIVGSNAVIPFGINEGVDDEVNIDFNSDGQVDFQIDHDRVNLNGTDLDYLQIDKNDVSSAANPLALDSPFFFATFDPGATMVNNPWNAKYVTASPTLGLYPSALGDGTPIGPSSNFDFQELDTFAGPDTYIRVNRLIDEDAGQIDTDGGQPAYSPLPGTPNFVGLGGQVRYLGLQMDLNSAAGGGTIFNYGWIGIQITNEDDATGNVVGWAYQTVPGQRILAGNVPEPSTILMALFGGVAVVFGLMRRRIFGGPRR